MVILNRNKRKIYVCAVKREGNIKKYEKPVMLYENYRVTNTEADLQVFGMDAYMYIKIETGIQIKNIIILVIEFILIMNHLNNMIICVKMLIMRYILTQ